MNAPVDAIAAVNGEDLAGDEGSSLAAQEGHHAGHLALLRQAVPTLQVEELRLIGEGEGSEISLPTLLARLQAATDLDLGRWLRAADPPG